MAEGEFALVKEHLETALAGTDIAPSFISPASDHDLYALLADVAGEQRDLTALQQYAPLAEETAVRCNHGLYQAIAHRAWGVAHRLAGEYTEAGTRLEQALAIFRKLDTRWQIGRTFVELGELALSRQDSTTARDFFANALSAFEALGAVTDAARTRAALESL